MHRYLSSLIAAIALLAGVSLAFSTGPPSLARQHHTTTTTQRHVFGSIGDLLNSNRANGPKQVFHIPAKGVKVGALRFLLQLYLVGQQNTPSPKSWLTTTPDDDDNTLQVYYHDGTGMLQLDMDQGITATRHGGQPSLQYQLQESVLLHGILDELTAVAIEADVEPSQRLLQLENEAAIANARESLPAKAAS